MDLGDRWSWYGVLDTTGELVLEQKLRTTPKAVKDVFRGDAAMPDRAGNGDAFALGEPNLQTRFAKH